MPKDRMMIVPRCQREHTHRRICASAATFCTLLLLVFSLCTVPALSQQQRMRCPVASADPDTLSFEAEKRIDSGDLNAAIACAQEVIRVVKFSPLGYELTAKVCILGGDLECCSQFCHRAWKLRGEPVICSSGHDLEALLQCGNCFASGESWAHALARYRAATSCAASASSRRASEYDAATLRMTEALANAYNNMGNVLRLQVLAIIAFHICKPYFSADKTLY